MSCTLKSILPEYILNIVKEYTGEGCWRNGIYINIHRISKNDPRYFMLSKKPKIKQLNYSATSNLKSGTTWFKLKNGKFVIINVLHGVYWDKRYNKYIVGDVMEIQYNNTTIVQTIV
jgi:hypothetical protein